MSDTFADSMVIWAQRLDTRFVQMCVNSHVGYPWHTILEADKSAHRNAIGSEPIRCTGDK